MKLLPRLESPERQLLLEIFAEPRYQSSNIPTTTEASRPAASKSALSFKSNFATSSSNRPAGAASLGHSLLGLHNRPDYSFEVFLRPGRNPSLIFCLQVIEDIGLGGARPVLQR